MRITDSSGLLLKIGRSHLLKFPEPSRTGSEAKELNTRYSSLVREHFILEVQHGLWTRKGTQQESQGGNRSH